MFKQMGRIKSEKEQMNDVIAAFKEKGIDVRVKDGYGTPSTPHWSASIGKLNEKELSIK